MEEPLLLFWVGVVDEEKTLPEEIRGGGMSRWEVAHAAANCLR